MKRFLITIALCALSFSAFAQKWVDASSFDVYGKAIPTEKPFVRIDTKVFPLETDYINRQARQTAGLFLHFKTDSKSVSARWTTSEKNSGDNMTAIGQKGLSLYMMLDGKWQLAGVGRPSMKKAPFTNHEHKMIACTPEGENEFLLYLPLYDTCESLEIGIDEGASIESLPNPFRHKVVILGSSITQGAASGHPGLLFNSIFTRETGIYTINLGFSGNCKLQSSFAEYLAAVEGADMFIIDGCSNPSVKEIRERFLPFMLRLREAHPTTPIVFLPSAYRELRICDPEYNKRFEDQRAACDEVMAAYKKDYPKDKNFYYLPELCFNKQANSLSTTDGVHANDYGFYLFLQDFTPAIKKVLKKYNLK